MHKGTGAARRGSDKCCLARRRGWGGICELVFDKAHGRLQMSNIYQREEQRGTQPNLIKPSAWCMFASRHSLSSGGARQRKAAVRGHTGEGRDRGSESAPESPREGCCAWSLQRAQAREGTGSRGCTEG